MAKDPDKFLYPTSTKAVPGEDLPQSSGNASKNASDLINLTREQKLYLDPFTVPAPTPSRT